MTEYTPSTGEVRRRYAYARSAGNKNQSAVAEFDRWLAAHDAEVRAESAEAHERTKRGAKTLGEIVERQIEDTLRWAGMEDQNGTDDPDQQLAWERCAEMPGRIAALEAELAEVRASVVAEKPEWEYGIEYSPHNEEFEGDSLASLERRVKSIREAGSYRDARVMRRRPAGDSEPVPVKQEGTGL